jgi:hypothetical protein
MLLLLSLASLVLSVAAQGGLTINTPYVLSPLSNPRSPHTAQTSSPASPFSFPGPAEPVRSFLPPHTPSHILSSALLPGPSLPPHSNPHSPSHRGTTNTQPQPHPYSPVHSILPGGQPNAAPLLDLGEQTGTSTTWIVNIGAGTPPFPFPFFSSKSHIDRKTTGTSLGLTLRDTNGLVAQSAPFTVLAGSTSAFSFFTSHADTQQPA